MNGAGPINIKEALLSARKRLKEKGLPNSGLDCRVLLENASGLDHSNILAYPFKILSAKALGIFESFIQRRLNGEPVSRILGLKEFWSLPFTVTVDTLDPRPDTETLVTHAIEFIKNRDTESSALKILDIGAGCGNISVAIASEVSNIMIFAADISLKALAVAKTNASKFNLSDRIEFINGNLLDHFKGGLDIIISNPPYIKSSDLGSLSSGITGYEPEIALDGGDDGLLFFRKIIDDSRNLLNPDGAIFFEVGFEQAERVEEMLLKSGTCARTSIFRDLSGIARVVSGRKR